MTLLEANGLSKWFTAEQPAVAGVDLTVRAGQTVGVVGESGSGKTTTARMILGLLRPDSGTISFDGTDLLGVRGSERRAVRARLQLVPQQPRSSLNPRLTAGASIEFNLRAHGWARTDRRRRVSEALEAVGLPAAFRSRYPSELSGGQIQRVAIARALATEPRLVICDEAVSALDKSVQAQVLNLLVRLQADLGVSFLFISHDLGAVEHIADEIAVMYRGHVVEHGSTRSIVGSPIHPYTQLLIDSIPGSRRSKRSPSTETVTDEAAAGGCVFSSRCPLADDQCRDSQPGWFTTPDSHQAKCYKIDIANVRAQSDDTASFDCD